MELKIEVNNIPLKNQKLEALVVFVAEDTDVNGSGLKDLPDDLNKQLSTSLKLRIFNGKKGSSQHFISGYTKIPQMLAIGVGKKNELDAETLRRAAGKAGKMLPALKANTVGFVLTSLLQNTTETDAGQVLVEGLTLGAYEFNTYKKQENNKSNTKFIKIHCCDPEKLTSLNALKNGKILADGTNMARTLGNTPANDLKPKNLAAEAKKIAKQYKMECTVLEEKDMKKLGMGMLLGVSRGSREPAKLIVLEYSHQKAKQTIALVGKGVTFDSGGISLKPGKNMDEMKFDMCGSAIVLGAMNAVADLRPKKNIVAIVPSTHNMLGGSAFLPGDILTAYNGKTIEILNTDAEGRLILADALAYASKHYDPAFMIDFATLTGACVVTFGHIATAILGNNPDLIKSIEKSSKNTGELVWELPLWDEYCDQVKSNISDVKNLGSPGQAGTIAGAAFLKAFVGKDIPWTHFDVAGTSWGVENRSYIQKDGASGQVVRLVLDLIGA